MKHGKERFVDFYDEEIKQLRDYFNYLDKNKTGTISPDELEEPLFALGFAENKDDIKKLLSAFTQTETGEIKLEEFYTLLKNSRVILI